MAERNLPQQVVTKRQSSTGMSSENDESESVSDFDGMHLLASGESVASFYLTKVAHEVRNSVDEP